MCQNRRALRELAVGVPFKELADHERERETLSSLSACLFVCLSVYLSVMLFLIISI